ncbi:hypothetical protein [Filifactor alocis]|uniref:hypothetical protein n=1 Tax=Filifactor alocis TaxID=143361 RepID=UPI003F9EFAAE
MPSQNKTKNLKLNQWQENEYPKMIDFNNDNKKIDVAFGNIEQKVTEGVEKLDVSGKQIEFAEASTRTLPKTGDTLKVIVSKLTKFLSDLKTVAFTGKYSDLTSVPESFPPAAHNHDDIYLGKLAKAANSEKLDGHDSSHFATAAQLQEVFQSVADGKSTLISAINKRLGYNSGLTPQNTWTDFVWWFENKFSEQGIVATPFNVSRYSDTEVTLDTNMRKVLFLQHQYHSRDYSTQSGKGSYNISTLIPVEPSKWIRLYTYYSGSSISVFVYPDFQKIRIAILDRNGAIDYSAGGFAVSFTLIGIK